VGKNESGKTAFLQSLQKLSPVQGTNGAFDLIEYPKKDVTKYKRVHDTRPEVAVQTEFELTEKETGEIEKAFGKGVLNSNIVKVSKDYNNKRSWVVGVNEAAVVADILRQADIPAEVHEQAKRVKTCSELIKYLENLADKPPSVESLLESLRQRFSTSVEHQIINNHLVKFIPRFVYFDDYSTMPGSTSIQYLLQRVQTTPDQLTPAERTFLALLALSGIELTDLQNQHNYQRIISDLEGASASITNEVFQFWSQNKQLRVMFDVFNADPNDPPPLNTGTILHVRIWNERHQVSVPFDERSRGFVWFFSFLAYFSQLEGEDGDLVLLLDEPGLSLHAKAQSDFLRFIDKRLAPKYQVVYTTHSPFMVDPTRLDRVRTVQDIDEVGTVVSEDVLRNDRDTIFPLQAALGYEIAQTLFVGPNCLLVEGSSDIVYLQVLSEAAALKGKTRLDPRWVLVPVGGADKIATFLSLLGANQLNIAVLMDVSTREQQRIENLQANELLGRSSLIQVSEFTDARDADIEDLFDPNFFIELVNKTYAGSLPKKLTAATLSKGNPRITQRLSAYFKEQNIEGGIFSHLRPAMYLLRHQQDWLDKIDDATLVRAAALFERANRLLDQER
jgi:predicted ATP-dependent endonuclease of OLD family